MPCNSCGRGIRKERCKRENTADTKDIRTTVQRCGQEVLQTMRADSSAVCEGDRHLLHYSLQRITWEPISTLQFVEDTMPQQADMPWRKVQATESLQHNFSQTGWQHLVICLLVFISYHELFNLIFCLCLVEEGKQEHSKKQTTKQKTKPSSQVRSTDHTYKTKEVLVQQLFSENSFIFYFLGTLKLKFLSLSQNGWGWQGPLGPSVPTLAQAGTPRVGCQGTHPSSFWRSPRRLHIFSGQPVPMLCHQHSKEVLPGVQRKPLVFQILSTVSCNGSGYLCKVPGFILYTTSL